MGQNLVAFYLLLWCCLLTVVVVYCETRHLETLRFAQVIFRHGNRTPDKTYGIYDENYSKYWPGQRGDLTNLGKKQTHDFGLYLRQRYDGFLSRAYRGEDIRTVSSQKDRNLQSASSCMRGLYKEYNDVATWSSDSGFTVPYEPIPVHTIPKEMDIFLSMDGDCPRASEILEDVKATYITDFYKANADFMEYLATQSGVPSLAHPLDNFNETYPLFYPVSETLQVIVESNITTAEEWIFTPKFLNEALPLLKSLNYQIFYQRTVTPEGLRLHGGPLANLVTNSFTAYRAGIGPRKMIVYAGHDKSILYLKVALGLEEAYLEQLAPYAAGLILELHQLPTLNEPTVEFWFRNETTREPYQLLSSICGDPCFYTKFLNMTAKFMDIDFEEECKNQN